MYYLTADGDTLTAGSCLKAIIITLKLQENTHRKIK